MRCNVFVGSSGAFRSDLEPLLPGMAKALGNDFNLIPWWSSPLQKDWSIVRDELSKLVLASDYAIFLLSPDDPAKVKGAECWLPRDNVIFELGMFLAGLGPDRVYPLVPKLPAGTEFRILSDVTGCFLPEYECIAAEDRQFKATKQSLGPALKDLAAKIRKHAEKEPGSLAPEAASASLKNEVGRLRTELSDDDATLSGDTQKIGHARTHIGRLIGLKAAATERSVSDVITDLCAYLSDIEDILDINQLATRQRVRNGEDPASVTEVWVFADPPLEFLTSGKAEVMQRIGQLRDTLSHNLQAGVRYRYVVPPEFTVNDVITVLNDLNVPEEYYSNISLIHLEAKTFKAFFTIHKRRDKHYDVYMSAIMNHRDDLLIKLQDGHAKRIVKTVSNLEKCENTVNHILVRDYVMEGSV